MRLPFYFPCCLARQVDYYYRKFKRKPGRGFLFYLGCTSFLILLLCCCSYIVVGILRDSGFICSSAIIAAAIHDNCSTATQLIEPIIQFSEAKIPPTYLCEELCTPGLAERISCHTKHLSKTYVFTLNLTKNIGNVKQVVVKSIENVVLEDDNADESYWKSTTAGDPVPTLTEFLNMFYTMMALFGTTQKDNIGLEMLLTSANSLYNGDQQHNMQRHHNFWQFVEDQEFIISVLMMETQLFPEIYGTCGNMYAMEFVDTLQENIFFPHSLKRDEKILKSIDIIKFVEKLDTAWSEPLHLCDVKMAHFGWTPDGVVKFVDLDSVVTESFLVNSLGNTPQCESDEDCTYFDCAAECDVTNSKCLPARINTNIQVVCSKVLLGIGSSVVSVQGLLAEETGGLLDALHLCLTNPGMTAPTLLHVLQEAYQLQPA